jgi:O-antigen/teichoic acid export membrane protein
MVVPEPVGTPLAGSPHQSDSHADLWRDIVKYFPALVLPRLIGLVTVPVLTRVFPANVLGTYTLVLATVNVLTAIGMTGQGAALMRFLPEHSNDVQARSNLLSLMFSLAAGFIVLIVLAGGTWLIFLSRLQDPVFTRLMLIGLLVFAASGMFGLVMIVLRSERRVGLYSTIQLLFGIGAPGLGLLLILVGGFDIGGMLWGTLIATCVATFAVWSPAIHGRFQLPRYTGPALRPVISFVVYVSLGSAAYWLLSLSDRWLVGLYLGANAVAMYAVSYDLTGKTSQLVMSAFSLAWQPAIIRTFEGQGRAATEALVSRAARSYLIVLLPATLGLSVLGREIVEVLATREYTAGAIVIPFVACAMFCYGLVDLAGRGLTLAKRPDLEARNFAVAGAINFALNVLMIPRFGLVAAAANTLLGYILLLALHLLTVRRYLAWRFPWATLGRVSAAAIGMGGVLLLADRAMGSLPTLARLLILVLLGVISYGVGILLTGEISVGEVVAGVRAAWPRKRDRE